MNLQQKNISFLEEHSRMAREARWGLYDNQNESSMKEICDIWTKRVTLATGGNMPVPPVHRGDKKKKKVIHGSMYGVQSPCKNAQCEH